MTRLLRVEVERLIRFGWTPDRIVELDYYLDATHCIIYRSRVDGLAELRYEALNDLTTRIVHPTLTFFEAATAWDHLPSGALVEAWTDGSGTPTDAAVGCGVVMRAQHQLLDLDAGHGLLEPPDSCSPFGPSRLVLSRPAQAMVAHRIGPGTNNTAELTGIQLALASCPRTDLKLIVRSDSAYSIGSLTNSTWVAKKNQDLIRHIKHHLSLRPAAFEHVRGHSGDPMNEAADQLAGRARKK